MKAFNPDELNVTTTGHEIIQTAVGKVAKCNWELQSPNEGKIAHYRITPEFREFLRLCEDKQGVIGFEYDFEADDLSFGVILRSHDDSQPRSAA